MDARTDAHGHETPAPDGLKAVDQGAGVEQSERARTFTRRGLLRAGAGLVALTPAALLALMTGRSQTDPAVVSDDHVDHVDHGHHSDYYTHHDHLAV